VNAATVHWAEPSTDSALAPTAWPAVCVVGPVPPPSGGMANQCEQLVRLLRGEGAVVELVRNNAPYRPAWAERLPKLRALFRLLPFLAGLWRAIGRADVVHVLSNSGWAWHLHTAPVLGIAALRRRPVIVNYRGGNADAFFAHAPRHVLASLRSAALRVTPSPYLQRVFGKYGLDACVVPNIVDLTRFQPRARHDAVAAPHMLIARNLEPIYDIATALRAFALVRRHYTQASLTVAGSGPQRAALEALAQELSLGSSVRFAGRVDNPDMPRLYATADCALNPSTVDNMPISILEAFASAVPVVSTDAGGIPDLVTHRSTGLLVPVGNAQAMADAVCEVLSDGALAQRLADAGLAEARRYAWTAVRSQWLAAYRQAVKDRSRA
jgi:glycosyltransferase involved in cell wall biosynthesis